MTTRTAYEGQCARCERRVTIALPDSEVQGARTVHVRCRECGQINWCHLSGEPVVEQ